MVNLIKFTIFSIFWFVLCYADDETHNIVLNDEKRLLRELIKNYTIDGKYGRPVREMNRTVEVGYGISLIQIMDVNEKDQVLTTNVWCKYRWTDETLTWDPQKYSNITLVRVPIDKIWKPDFVLYNYADERLTEHRDVMALINPDGYVMYIPPAIFKSSCLIDTTNFPFDEQTCKLKFGSWTYNGKALDPFFLEGKEYIELSEYVPSQEWVILEHYGMKNIITYECCPNEPYPDLTFYLTLRRRAAFYSYTLILPCVLLSAITMVLFMLPPETPGKMLLGINIFVGFFMLLLLLQESAPPTTKQIPILGAYYCFNMVMTTVSTFLCSILVDMHYRADKRYPPGPWLTFIVIRVIGRAMFMHIPLSMNWIFEEYDRKIFTYYKKPKLRSSMAVLKQRITNKGADYSCDCIVVRTTENEQPLALDGKRSKDLDRCSFEDVDEQRCCETCDSKSPPLSPGRLSRKSTINKHAPIVVTSKNSTASKSGIFVGATVQPTLPENEGTDGDKQPNICPSSSFDRVHYNKFKMVQHSPLASTVIPITRRLGSKVNSLSKAIKHTTIYTPTTTNCPAIIVEGDASDSFVINKETDVEMFEKELNLIHALIDSFNQRIIDKELNKQYAELWRMMSMIFDRIFLFGYMISMVFSLTCLFPHRPADVHGERFPNGTLVFIAREH